jgi:hypothetical protein
MWSAGRSVDPGGIRSNVRILACRAVRLEPLRTGVATAFAGAAAIVGAHRLRSGRAVHDAREGVHVAGLAEILHRHVRRNRFNAIGDLILLARKS